MADDSPVVGGAPVRRRSDARLVEERLLAAVGEYAAIHGVAPSRLVEVAALANVATATAYRHFSSVEDAIGAYLLRLPREAVRRFMRRTNDSQTDRERFFEWNHAWVLACIAHGPISVRLRSSEGFLARRRSGDATVAFVCNVVEPLLAPLGDDPLELLWVWNALSDPREVLDQHVTRRRSARSIATFITNATISSAA
jgi:AcrR family transcriptional regulator